MIETVRDLAFASKEEAQRCFSAIRFTNGQILQCKGFKEIVDEPNRRRLRFPDIQLDIDFESYSLLIYNSNHQFIVEREYEGGSASLIVGDVLRLTYNITWKGNGKERASIPECSLSLSLPPGLVSQPLTPCVWESILIPS